MSSTYSQREATKATIRAVPLESVARALLSMKKKVIICQSLFQLESLPALYFISGKQKRRKKKNAEGQDASRSNDFTPLFDTYKPKERREMQQLALDACEEEEILEKIASFREDEHERTEGYLLGELMQRQSAMGQTHRSVLGKDENDNVAFWDRFNEFVQTERTFGLVPMIVTSKKYKQSLPVPVLRGFSVCALGSEVFEVTWSLSRTNPFNRSVRRLFSAKKHVLLCQRPKTLVKMIVDGGYMALKAIEEDNYGDILQLYDKVAKTATRSDLAQDERGYCLLLARSVLGEKRDFSEVEDSIYEQEMSVLERRVKKKGIKTLDYNDILIEGQKMALYFEVACKANIWGSLCLYVLSGKNSEESSARLGFSEWLETMLGPGRKGIIQDVESWAMKEKKELVSLLQTHK